MVKKLWHFVKGQCHIVKNNSQRSRCVGKNQGHIVEADKAYDRKHGREGVVLSVVAPGDLFFLNII